MKKVSASVVFLYLLGILAVGPAVSWAGEHGGSTMQEHGGTMMADNENDDAATLKQAAAELKTTNPELSKKLEKMAAKQCSV